MGMNYHFGEAEDKLRDACCEYPPDLEKVEYLMEHCEDLTVFSPQDREETILSDVILWYPETKSAVRELRHPPYAPLLGLPCGTGSL